MRATRNARTGGVVGRRQEAPAAARAGQLASVDTPAMRLSEVARRLAISRAAAYRLVRSGQLPGVQIGHAWRVLRADFDDYLSERRAEAERRYRAAREKC